MPQRLLPAWPRPWLLRRRFLPIEPVVAAGRAVKRGYIGSDPFRDVTPIGKPRAGKPQLRIEEARLFTKAALRHFEEWIQPLALGALLALMMGLRTSEVMNRVVRDLDDHAHYLWIDEGKTRNARRHLEVPSMLSLLLLRLAQGKHPEELLFGVRPMRPRRACSTPWHAAMILRHSAPGNC